MKKSKIKKIIGLIEEKKKLLDQAKSYLEMLLPNGDKFFGGSKDEVREAKSATEYEALQFLKEARGREIVDFFEDDEVQKFEFPFKQGDTVVALDSATSESGQEIIEGHKYKVDWCGFSSRTGAISVTLEGEKWPETLCWYASRFEKA